MPPSHPTTYSLSRFCIQHLPLVRGRDGDRDNHLYLHSPLPWFGTRLDVEGSVMRPVVGSHDIGILPWAPGVLHTS